MARTIAEIKQEIADLFITDEKVKALYGLEPGKKFEDQFSKVSLESILFYIAAVYTWTLEKLFDRHRQELTELINELKPHSLRWYANKAKAFQFGRSLIPDTDQYDNTGLNDEQIREQQVVKYSAVEEKEGGVVFVKVATGSEGSRTPLSAEQEEALAVYFKKIKDAGVKVEIVNKPAHLFNINIDIHYDPQVFDKNLNKHIDGSGQVVHNAIASFVENLPFNGEYRDSALINILTGIEGVVLVDLKEATDNGKIIPAKCVPDAGYFRVDKKSLGIKAVPYESIQN